MYQMPGKETREQADAIGRTRSHRKGAGVRREDERDAYERDAMRKNEKASSALEAPQGAAAHPVGTPDGVTARHGPRSF